MATILVLEDEPAVMKFLRHMLRQYTLVEAATAEQAFHAFSDREIDILVADVTLPRGSGIQLALLLRSRSPDLPVILMSGYPLSYWNDGDRTDLAKLGSSSVAILQKPFHSPVLQKAIRELIGTQGEEMARVV
jgi:DNA-binding response OmpR family regulator